MGKFPDIWDKKVEAWKLMARHVPLGQICPQVQRAERTLRNWKKELLSLSVELVRTLPPEVQKCYENETGRKLIPFREMPLANQKELEKHWADLTKVADRLRSNLLKIWGKLSSISSGEAELLGNIIDGGFISSAIHPGPILGETDRDNPYRLEKTNSYLTQCLLSHLKAEFAKEFKLVTDWRQLNPTGTTERMIQKLTLVSHRRTFQGTCDVCKCWAH